MVKSLLFHVKVLFEHTVGLTIRQLLGRYREPLSTSCSMCKPRAFLGVKPLKGEEFQAIGRVEKPMDTLQGVQG